ncbi:uncharacterized protein V6R79_024161 [Siganus canaliculatus]
MFRATTVQQHPLSSITAHLDQNGRVESSEEELASTNSANSSQTTAADNKEKAPAAKPQEQEEEIDIDLEAPETEKAALAIQNQFRRFQKKKK